MENDQHVEREQVDLGRYVVLDASLICGYVPTEWGLSKLFFRTG